MRGQNQEKIEASQTGGAYGKNLQGYIGSFLPVLLEIIDAQDDQQRRSEYEMADILAVNLREPQRPSHSQ